jgi:transcriptional regulator with XRE-family HTH domain
MMNEKNARKVKAWLLLQGIKQAKIADELGVSRATIHHWIAGRVQSQRIYNYFITAGCPREYFAGRPEARKAA